jgi:hypothetical protein
MFARTLWRGAREEESHVQFIALVELVTKKGGTPFGFVLCRHTMFYDDPDKDENEMVRIKPKMIWDEVRKFWPHDTRGEGDFPDCENDRWERTTPCLYSLVVESWSFERYVKVGRPRPRRKKVAKVSKSVSVLPVECVLSREEQHLLLLEEEMSRLRSECASLELNEGGRTSVPKENQNKHAFLLRKIARLEIAIKFSIREKPQIDPAFLRPIGRILGSVNRVLTSP